MKKVLIAVGALVVLLGGAASVWFFTSGPESPTITPKSADVRAVTPRGLELVAHVEVKNPNAIALTVREVRARVTLDGRIDLGQVTQSSPVALPAREAKELAIPLSVGWTDLPAVAMLALGQKPVACVIAGSVQVGGETLRVDLPFRLEASIPTEKLRGVALGAIPKLPDLLR